MEHKHTPFVIRKYQSHFSAAANQIGKVVENDYVKDISSITSRILVLKWLHIIVDTIKVKEQMYKTQEQQAALVVPTMKILVRQQTMSEEKLVYQRIAVDIIEKESSKQKRKG